MVFDCTCCGHWSKEDEDADNDCRQQNPGISTSDVKETRDPTVTFEDSDGPEDSQEDALLMVTGKAIDTAPVDALVAASEEAISRTDAMLTKGGLLMTQIINDHHKVVRKVHVNLSKGTMEWEVGRVLGLFGDPRATVKLQNVQLSRDGKAITIHNSSRLKQKPSIFEAADEEEAAAVCDSVMRRCKEVESKIDITKAAA